MSLKNRYFAVPFVFALLGGCNQVQLAVSDNSVPLAAQQPSKTIESNLEKGMPYADFRKVIVNGGWDPVIDPECKLNVAGADFKAICESDPDLESCQICDHLPELSSCSGDAYCGMFFSNGSKKLHVVTFGDFSDWNVTGDESQLSVESWDFSAI